MVGRSRSVSFLGPGLFSGANSLLVSGRVNLLLFFPMFSTTADPGPLLASWSLLVCCRCGKSYCRLLGGNHLVLDLSGTEVFMKQSSFSYYSDSILARESWILYDVELCTNMHNPNSESISDRLTLIPFQSSLLKVVQGGKTWQYPNPSAWVHSGFSWKLIFLLLWMFCFPACIICVYIYLTFIILHYIDYIRVIP